MTPFLSEANELGSAGVDAVRTTASLFHRGSEPEEAYSRSARGPAGCATSCPRAFDSLWRPARVRGRLLERNDVEYASTESERRTPKGHERCAPPPRPSRFPRRADKAPTPFKRRSLRCLSCRPVPDRSWFAYTVRLIGDSDLRQETSANFEMTVCVAVVCVCVCPPEQAMPWWVWLTCDAEDISNSHALPRSESDLPQCHYSCQPSARP
jgi:hypothetical protein